MNTNTLNPNQSLIDATIKADRPTVTELLSRGADVNAKDDNGQTALIVATYKGEVGLVHLLLEKGADPRIPDRDGWTAFKYAEQLEETAILELLGDADEIRVQPSAAPTELATFTPTARTAMEVRSGDETVAGKDWRDAVSIGSLIGGSIVILIALFVKPQVTQTAATNSVSSGSSNSSASSNSSSSSSSATSTTITENQAVNLIDSYLKAKRTIFSPPYNKQIAARLTTGKRYKQILGSVQWLQENQAYYHYLFSEVQSLGNFVNNSNQAVIEVLITEDLIFYINGVVDESNTTYGKTSKKYRFFLEKDGNNWKIADVNSL